MRGLSLVFFVFHDVAELSKVVLIFFLSHIPVLDSSGGTVPDAGHTVCAIFAPDRFFLFHLNIAEGAKLRAFSAADAGIGCEESLCCQFIFDPDRIEWYGNNVFE